jgi:hypothetical protein
MEKVFRITPLKNQHSDYQYWVSRSIEERLNAIEILRQQYLEFNKNAQSRLQRVCRIIKKNKRLRVYTNY